MQTRMNTAFKFSIPAKMTVFHPINIIIGRFLLKNFRKGVNDITVFSGGTSTFAQFMNSRIQKLINSLTRGNTSKTEGDDPTTWTEPAAVGDPDIVIDAVPRATAQHAP